MSCSQLTSIEQWHRSLSTQCISLQHLKFPIIGYKPCLHDTGHPAMFASTKNKQVVQIRIQVYPAEAVLERWSLTNCQWLSFQNAMLKGSHSSNHNISKLIMTFVKVHFFVIFMYQKLVCFIHFQEFALLWFGDLIWIAPRVSAVEKGYSYSCYNSMQEPFTLHSNVNKMKLNGGY